MGRDVDVALSVYGKPMQTAATLASLLAHSGSHVGTVFLQEEARDGEAPFASALPLCWPEFRWEPFVAPHAFGVVKNDVADLFRPARRRSIRYQLAWEQSTAPFLFVTHNDCVYGADVVGQMRAGLQRGGFTAAGAVGQCWNCPAGLAALCDGTRFDQFRPSFEEAACLVAAFPSARTVVSEIDRHSPMPLPECRLNEFACLIDLARCRDDVAPEGPVPPLGFMGFDTGSDWFRGLSRRGHRFLHWTEGFAHAPFGTRANGHDADDDDAEYALSEERAHGFLRTHYPALLARFEAAREAP